MNDKLVILDLDETLVYASEEHLGYEHDFEVSHYLVYKRPYLREFIDFVLENFRVAIWTSSGEDYAAEVVNCIFGGKDKLEFVWARNRCVRRFDPKMFEQYFIKDLKKVRRLGYSLDHILMIDDTPKKLMRNYGNLVRVSPFEGDRRDEELLDLMPYLEELKSTKDIRSLEKRGWKRRNV
jgi:Dullard-like phosphatase family protein